ncbi:thiamine pyrophosphate-dependent dehydrogenase E1 component subunit alpha [Alicyclobacillus tolerans]|uniref:thiamine pyrophosphate-dependent dehydrogenase E1 component subunit alpha n=1 Tax=Alicyclobacillus tolerans TaxID=90970 RepID=UPI001F431331|nr:thiamine pyrophosphate-dependent dehydrogenase E1 component subunit alpha [Alicyclobacillus tolerans]MCF8563656.1 thiamine pyrophosphate-dependent dehydrogenase E1 component subunit alpha [Alicyclobacillus tolerans]
MAMTKQPRHQELGLTDAQVIDMYQYMVLARMVDERLWLLNRAGKIPFVISCQGQEGAQAGAGFALNRDVDYIAPYYRDLCLVLIWGHTPKTELLAAFAKAEDPNSGGRQMPGHYGDKQRRILSGSSPVGTQIPHAVGAALAAKMRGEPCVSMVSFGEGTSNQGDFHEAANFAGVHKLPVIFFCENNRYAISVPETKQLGCTNVADRAPGYGFEGVVVDGMDPFAVYEAVKRAADKARSGGGPTLVEAKAYRLVPHSSDDDDRSYRSREEVEHAKQTDSLVRMRMYVLENGLLSEQAEEELRQQAQKQVNEGTEYAQNAPYPEASTLTQYVYGEGE